jgi:hypothetical protein
MLARRFIVWTLADSTASFGGTSGRECCRAATPGIPHCTWIGEIERVCAGGEAESKPLAGAGASVMRMIPHIRSREWAKSAVVDRAERSLQ